jgi:hypothetical protein
MFSLSPFFLSRNTAINLDQKQVSMDSGLVVGYQGTPVTRYGQSFTAGFDQVLRYLDVGFYQHYVSGGITITMVCLYLCSISRLPVSS